MNWLQQHEWIAILLVMGILSVLLQTLSVIKARFKPHPEIIRKSLHIIMGVVTLSFPWVFAHAWPVAILAFMTTFMFALLEPLSKVLSWNRVLEVNGRRSTGQICFPLAVAIVFAFSRGDPLLYCVPILLLTLADAMSALVGVKYGSHRYATVDGEKSTEGSLAFFMVAFLGTHIPILLFTDLTRLDALLIGLIMGLLGALVEGIAWRGFDNLFVPVGAYIVLIGHLSTGTVELFTRFLVLMLLLSFSIAWRKKTTLNGSAILGVALFSYFSFVIGGLGWMVLPLIVFASYRFLMPRRFWSIKNAHSVYGVLSVASTGVLWLLWAHYDKNPDLIYPYTIAFAAHSAIITIAHVRSKHLNAGRLQVMLAAVAKSWCLLFIPLVLIVGVSAQSLLMAAIAPVCIAIPTIAFYLTQRNSEAPLTSANRWLRQAGFAIAGSFLGLIPVLLIP